MSNPSGRETILDKAIKLTLGDRNDAYGEPVANMQHMADIFNAITGHKLSAREAALFYQVGKISRRYKNPTHEDSYVDGAAYTGIEYECAMAEATSNFRKRTAAQGGEAQSHASAWGLYQPTLGRVPPPRDADD